MAWEDWMETQYSPLLCDFPGRLRQLRIALTPKLPGRRIQDHHCLPAPFQREAWCLRKCRNPGYACATWKGDEPLEVQNCPGAKFWNKTRCGWDSQTPKCRSVSDPPPPPPRPRKNPGSRG